MLIVLIALLVAVVVFLASLANADRLTPIVALVLVTAGLLVVLALLVWSMLRTITVIRHPPRLTANGMRLWLTPVGEYVFVPWPEVTAVRATTKGIGTGLYVHVNDPDRFAGGASGKARKIRNFAQRYGGAPFAYPISSSQASLHGIDNALRGYTNGWQALRREQSATGFSRD
ncbi:MAG: hypothetical protein GEU97_01910 [Actinophytocola sp.]|nr:hypothetical protein [Actinophytocola sp.]